MSEELRQLDYHEMGKRIRARRESLNMNREMLAEKLEVSPQFIADIEYGNKGVSIRKLYLLCQALDTSADFILAGERRDEEDDEDLNRLLFQSNKYLIFNIIKTQRSAGSNAGRFLRLI